MSDVPKSRALVKWINAAQEDQVHMADLETWQQLAVQSLGVPLSVFAPSPVRRSATELASLQAGQASRMNELASQQQQMRGQRQRLLEFDYNMTFQDTIRNVMQNSVLSGSFLNTVPKRWRESKRKPRKERKHRMNKNLTYMGQKIQEINFSRPVIDELVIWENFKEHLKVLEINAKITVEHGLKHIKGHSSYQKTRWDGAMNFLKDMTEAMGKNSKKEKFTMKTKTRHEELIVDFLSTRGSESRFMTDDPLETTPTLPESFEIFPASSQFMDLQAVIRNLLACASYDDMHKDMESIVPGWKFLVNAYVAGAWKVRVTEREATIIVRPNIDCPKEPIASDQVAPQPRSIFDSFDRPRRQERLHNAKGPAFYWEKEKFYFIKGIHVSEQIVLAPETLEPMQIEDERNTEVRRIMMEQYGVEKYFKQSGAKSIHQDETGILYRKEMGNGRGGRGEDICFVRVKNSTPEPDGSIKEYWLRVPPETQTAKEGVAWTFSEESNTYHPKVQT